MSFGSTSPQNVINQFHALASEGKCNFIGNIDVGSTVTVQFLKERYHAVVLVSASKSVVRHTVCTSGTLVYVPWCEVGMKCYCASASLQAYGAAKDRTLDIPGEVTSHWGLVLFERWKGLRACANGDLVFCCVSHSCRTFKGCILLGSLLDGTMECQN